MVMGKGRDSQETQPGGVDKQQGMNKSRETGRNRMFKRYKLRDYRIGGPCSVGGSTLSGGLTLGAPPPPGRRSPVLGPSGILNYKDCFRKDFIAPKAANRTYGICEKEEEGNIVFDN